MDWFRFQRVFVQLVYVKLSVATVFPLQARTSEELNFFSDFFFSFPMQD